MIQEGESQAHGAGRRGDVSIATIARLAGVSRPTVSKVLNGHRGISTRTRQRVEALLREHGYRWPMPATTPCLEVVFHQMLGSIAIEILRGADEVASARECTVGFTDIRQQTVAGLSWVEPMLRRRPIAVIAVSSMVTVSHGEQLVASGIPLVAIDPIDELFPTPAVASKNVDGARTATRHLLDLGHRRIGVVTGPVRDLSARARFDGFRDALAGAGIASDTSLQRHGAFTFEDGRDLGLQLIALPQRPTAIVCGDDLQALGVYEAARQAGLRIPDDLSVVGFDDIGQAAWAAPPLTTVRQEFAQMGAAAARLALALADGERLTQDRYELDTTLIVRGSTSTALS
ncbi:LacI family DNA-binding transcriptional regulator [Phytohabitans houttuyneae]|uniref:LacI family transcriptional regulator n=1 Tax=Phytohabitans houttuyneae TaxID=1076126 RepID=A0A6V8KKF8_9ACTN|nr:LacI family DNA-binding transcriptional regulator [Phytohabitans houttuyneae]GFJ81175.1 LacI family transcriptional regulator [Phytohabitans houttuyneae]